MDETTEHLDGRLEQDYSDGSVHVVVTVKKDGLAGGDGVFQALDGTVHSEHEERIMKMRELGIEEGGGFSGLGNATSDEKLGENEGKTGFAGESCGFVGVRIVDNPALARDDRALARQRGLR
jgi:hypothetical protein